MAEPSSSDKTLLDRLNALKPTSVSLDTASNALNVSATGIQPVEPPSREDDLAARLRTLRNKGQASPGSTTAPAQSVERGPPPPYSAISSSPAGGRAQPPTSQIIDPERAGHRTDQASPAPPPGSKGGDDGLDDSLFAVDESALDELLEGLGDDIDHLSEEEEGGDDSRRVAELLRKLRLDPSAQPPRADEKSRDYDDTANERDEDDSEGEEMKRAVQDVMAQALDEAEFQRSQEGDEAAEPKEKPSKEDVTSNDTLTLPTVPTDPEDNPSTAPATHPNPTNKDDPFALPAVPTDFKDPIRTPEDSTALDFENDITRRMAALKGGRGGGGGGAVQFDGFGFPTAPSFQPEDRPLKKKNVTKRAGFTDEDQKTWCIVCLDDATVRCVGCDDDVYCARCWRDMHVGPSAGYDERGHKWVKFSRGDL